MNANVIQQSLDNWIQTISSESIELLRKVFDSIGSVRTIHNINKAAMELGRLGRYTAWNGSWRVSVALDTSLEIHWFLAISNGNFSVLGGFFFIFTLFYPIFA